MKKRYRVAFYDMFDGWSGRGIDKTPDDYTSLDKAIKVCTKKQLKLPDSNKSCGEHYGVIDLETGLEVYCGKRVKNYPRSSTEQEYLPSKQKGTGSNPVGGVKMPDNIFLLFVLRQGDKVVGYEKHMFLSNPMTSSRDSIHIYHSKTGHPMSWKCVCMNDNEKCYILHDSKEVIDTIPEVNNAGV